MQAPRISAWVKPCDDPPTRLSRTLRADVAEVLERANAFPFLIASGLELRLCGVATNLEQLFAAGCAPCFDNALRVVARRRRMPASETSVTARVGIGPQ